MEVKFWACNFGSGCSRGGAALESGNVSRSLTSSLGRPDQYADPLSFGGSQRELLAGALRHCETETGPRYDIRFACDTPPLQIYYMNAVFLAYCVSVFTAVILMSHNHLCNC
jgi:hypothetical protein